MSSKNKIKKKKWFSNLMLIAFLFLVLATALLSNAFKTPVKSHNEFIEQSLVFNKKELENITGLSLRNKSGEFTFSRTNTEASSQWHMTSPRDISSSSLFVEKLFSTLNVIKTKNLLADDLTNRSNFSLDKPTATLTLIDNAGKNIILSVGIMNTIDNSTYLKISEKTGIFHVEAPSISLENITINDLIESNVFDINLATLSSFKIFKRNSTIPQFAIFKKAGIWVNSEEKPLNIKKIEETLDDFSIIKSTFILDQMTDSQKKQTLAMVTPPEYTLKIENDLKETYTYLISDLKKNIPDVPDSDVPQFIIIEGHAPIVYVLKKEVFTLFELKNESLIIQK